MLSGARHSIDFGALHTGWRARQDDPSPLKHMRPRVPHHGVACPIAAGPPNASNRGDAPLPGGWPGVLPVPIPAYLLDPTGAALRCPAFASPKAVRVSPFPANLSVRRPPACTVCGARIQTWHRDATLSAETPAQLQCLEEKWAPCRLSLQDARCFLDCVALPRKVWVCRRPQHRLSQPGAAPYPGWLRLRPQLAPCGRPEVAWRATVTDLELGRSAGGLEAGKELSHCLRQQRPALKAVGPEGLALPSFRIVCDGCLLPNTTQWSLAAAPPVCR